MTPWPARCTSGEEKVLFKRRKLTDTNCSLTRASFSSDGETIAEMP